MGLPDFRVMKKVAVSFAPITLFEDEGNLVNYVRMAMPADLKELVTQLGCSTSPQPDSWWAVDGLFITWFPSADPVFSHCHSQNLVFQLLQFNPMERLGAGVAGVEDIKSHPFFTPVDWAELTR